MIKHYVWPYSIEPVQQCETQEDYLLVFYRGSSLQADLNEFDTRLPVADKALWVDALLTGNYMQGTSRLKTVIKHGFKHCCLGVLCEVQNVKQAHTLKNIPAIAFEGETATLPLSIRDKFGLDEYGTFVYTFTVYDELFGHRINLVTLNDELFTFSQIADVINYFF